MSDNKVTPAILAALAIVGGYGSVAPVDSAVDSSQAAPHQVSRETEELAVRIHQVIKDMKAFAADYGKISKELLASLPDRSRQEALGLKGLDDLGAILDSLRGTELALKNATVPAGLEALHMDLRKAAGGLRSRVSTFYSLYKQSITVPVTFDSGISMDGLRALADHSTRKAVVMANA